LEAQNYELISTGGTFKHLKDAGLNPIQIDEVTNFPEMLDGRVKTLHPKVHGGLLAVRNNEEHMKTVQEHGIGLIDMVIVNLYPFFENVTKTFLYTKSRVYRYRRTFNASFCSEKL
jgi:phosphoribosylaminoimidazolecarboxamide formyltransferase/IMP cyclohydrolase